MSVKQDRTALRTPEDLERKYQFAKSFGEILGIATDARGAADEAREAVSNLDRNLTPDEIFYRLTNGGQSQGIYRENGEIYINASFIKSGFISSDLIKAGVIRSVDYESSEMAKIFPDSNAYPSASMFPNNGEDITKGIEIDFAAGVIRGVLVSSVTESLAARIAALEEAVFNQ